MLRFLAIPVVVFSLLATACQTSMLKQFSSVKPGMEKDDVLDIMGTPNRTQRHKGKDRWTYVFYDDRIRFEKEIQFFEGNAVYIGDIALPEENRTAIAMDSANERKNREIDEALERETAKNRKAYEDYEKKTRGDDKVRYVPRFEPVR